MPSAVEIKRLKVQKSLWQKLRNKQRNSEHNKQERIVIEIKGCKQGKDFVDCNEWIDTVFAKSFKNDIPQIQQVKKGTKVESDPFYFLMCCAIIAYSRCWSCSKLLIAEAENIYFNFWINRVRLWKRENISGSWLSQIFSTLILYSSILGKRSRK